MSRVSVRYMIDDVPAAMRFYTTLLGFTLEQDASPAFASLVRDGVRLLLSGDGSSGKRPLPDGRRQQPGGWNRVHLEVADLPAEVRLKLEETARQHWVTWFDLPVPALNNMTPKEAAKTEEGRELLESLLLDYERHDDADNENLMRPDIPELRRKLGMHV